MPTYTFFRYGTGPDSPSFDIMPHPSRAAAIERANLLLADNPQYYAVEVLEGDNQVALVRRRPVQVTGTNRRDHQAGQSAH